MERILVALCFCACTPLLALEPSIPNSVPPFALGDFCTATATDLDGQAYVRIEMFGWRSRVVKTAGDRDNVPVEVDGKMMHPDKIVSDTFSPTRSHYVTTPLASIVGWDRSGEKLTVDSLSRRLRTKVHAVIVSRELAKHDVAFLEYFGDDVVFIRLDKLTEPVLKQGGR